MTDNVEAFIEKKGKGIVAMKELVALRKKLGIKQSEVGDAMGYTAHSCIAQAETGKRPPSKTFVARYRRALSNVCVSKHRQFAQAIVELDQTPHRSEYNQDGLDAIARIVSKMQKRSVFIIEPSEIAWAAAMRTGGATFAEIGDTLQVPRERIRQRLLWTYRVLAESSTARRTLAEYGFVEAAQWGREAAKNRPNHTREVGAEMARKILVRESQDIEQARGMP